MTEFPRITYRKIKKYKYQTWDTYIFQTELRPEVEVHCGFITLRTNGQLIIHRGYCWDGPSGPTIDTKAFVWASLPHDALYQLIRMGLLAIEGKYYADRYLREMCLVGKMNKFRAWYVYKSVDKFGWSSCKPVKFNDKIFTAP